MKDKQGFCTNCGSDFGRTCPAFCGDCGERTSHAAKLTSSDPNHYRGSKDNPVCQCGKPKWPDADSCGNCYHGYPDNWLNR